MSNSIIAACPTAQRRAWAEVLRRTSAEWKVVLNPPRFDGSADAMVLEHSASTVVWVRSLSADIGRIYADVAGHPHRMSHHHSLLLRPAPGMPANSFGAGGHEVLQTVASSGRGRGTRQEALADLRTALQAFLF